MDCLECRIGLEEELSRPGVGIVAVVVVVAVIGSS